MAEARHPDALQGDAHAATDLLASLLMERSDARPEQARTTDGLTAKIYAVMAVTTLLTFATLSTGYQLLFSHQLLG